MSENKELFITNVGSHMWGMNRPDSDIDLFIVYQAPSTDFLVGKAHTNSHRSMNENIDRVSFELGHVVSQLLKGNINYLWGVMSPKIIKDWDRLQSLRELTTKNLSKQLYHSVHGLGLHNYKKYVESEKDPTAKRCTLICRSLNFGTKLLTKGMFSFGPMEPCTPKDTLDHLHALDLAYVSSPLPESPEHKREMEAWLLDVRLHKLKEELPIFFS